MRPRGAEEGDKEIRFLSLCLLSADRKCNWQYSRIIIKNKIFARHRLTSDPVGHVCSKPKSAEKQCSHCGPELTSGSQHLTRPGCTASARSWDCQPPAREKMRRYRTWIELNKVYKKKNILCKLCSWPDTCIGHCTLCMCSCHNYHHHQFWP